MGDPNFERSVVLMLEHSPDGALGVVLNRVSAAPVAELLPQWAPLASAPPQFFFGGPVSTQSLIGLARGVGAAAADFQPIVGSAGVIDLHKDPGELGMSIDHVRIFAGYSGWGPLQLEAELATDAWFVLDADPLDAFFAEPDQLWSFVLRRQHGPMAWLANYPVDPRLN
jgi:putative transcriptional regulator